MRKAYSLCFDSKSGRPETSAEMLFRLDMVGVTHPEDTVFEVVNSNAVKWPATMSFKDTTSVKMVTDISHDTAQQPMINESIELTHRLVSSYEECFSQPSPDLIASMRAHPFFAGIGFEELKTMREDVGDGHELMKKLVIYL